MTKYEREINGAFELTIDKIDDPLWNHDLSPVPFTSRTWTKWTMMTLWVSMSISIPAYMLGSSLVGNGMNLWQAMLTIIIGNIIVLIPMALIAHPGPKYGVPFPVLIRSSFGTQGAKLTALFRAFVACGWFGIQSCIAGSALYVIFLSFFPSIKNSAYLGNFIAIDFWHLVCVVLIVLFQMLIIHYGIEMIKKVEVFAAPLLVLLSLFLLGWVWVKTGSIENIFKSSELLSQKNHIGFWITFWPGLTAIVGFWATLALNIPDFTRFVKSQKDQIIGQALGMPTTMAFISFIGIVVTSTTVLVFGQAIWNPIDLINKFGSSYFMIIPLLGLIVATICCNMAANLVSSANDFSNLFPNHINFKCGGYITCIIGLLIFPWKLIADPHGYIFRWLIAYSALLGAVGGIMVADYYVIRKTKLTLIELFKTNGEYTYTRGWNLKAFFSLIIGILPNLPGFMVQVGLLDQTVLPLWINNLYNYAWFISFAIAFIVYSLAMKHLK